MGKNETALPLLGCGFIMVYGLAQLWAGFGGIQVHLGAGWALGALGVAIFFRFSLPITIGAFFGARDVWGWHWSFALIFAAPGLLFMGLMIPGALASLMGKKK
jgi:hypothetical protein